MPTLPQFLHVAREERVAEVGLQPDIQQLRRTDSDVAVAREVGINLYGKQDTCPNHAGRGIIVGIVQQLVHIVAHTVGNDDFLGQTPQNLPHADDSRVIVKLLSPQELGQQVGRPLDGAGHQLRGKGDEHAEGHRIARGLDIAAIHVDGVADGLERVKRDTHRQQDIQCGPVGIYPEKPQQVHKAVPHEVQILEHGQDAQVEHDVGRCPRAVMARAVAAHHQRRAECGHRREHDQAQHLPVPPTIKNVTGDQQEQVLPLEVAAQAPVDEKHQGQEQRVCIGIKLHKSVTKVVNSF